MRWLSGLIAAFTSAACGWGASLESSPDHVGETSSALLGNCTAWLTSFSPPSPGQLWIPVNITGSGSCANGVVEYEFWGRPPGGPWSVFCNWQPGTTCHWDASSSTTNGGYEFQLWTRAQGSGEAYEGYSPVSVYVMGSWYQCTSATLAASANGPVAPGAIIHLTSTATCHEEPASYQFWVLPPGAAAWTIACDWADAPGTCDYTVTASGEHQFQAWTRAATSDAYYEAASNVVYYGDDDCQSTTLTVTQGSGNIVNLDATALCTSGSAEFKYWVDEGSGWITVCDWTPGSCAWDTTGLPQGAHDIQAWARAVGSKTPYQSASSLVTYGGGRGDCQSTTLSVAAGGGNIVDLAAAATCTSGSPEFKYWVEDDLGNWSVVCDWTQGACAWDTTGLLMDGAHYLQAWARVIGSHEAYQSYSSLVTYGGGTCPSVTLTIKPSWGHHVDLMGQATCDPSAPGPEYKYWVRGPTGAWTAACDWGAICWWETDGLPYGVYEFQAWVRSMLTLEEYQGYSDVVSYTLGLCEMGAPDGTPCDDGLMCTVNDVCSGGQCVGAPNPCFAPGNECKVGVCDEISLACVAWPVQEGATCDDHDACTSGTTCTHGTCGGAGTVITGCVSGDGCCPPGCTAALDGDCPL